MTSPSDEVLSSLGIPVLTTGVRSVAHVSSHDGTTREEPKLMANTSGADAFEEYSRRADSLFGASAAYVSIKKEKPEHRIMLWLRLQGHNQKEVAQLTGYTQSHVSLVCNQPWFLEAFSRLSTEFGADAVTTFLEGEVLSSAQALAKLRDNAESEAVRLSAANSIIDRARGKAVSKVEVKETARTDLYVHDVAKLQEEFDKNARILGSYGINTRPNAGPN